jgi:hypothetical protein
VDKEQKLYCSLVNLVEIAQEIASDPKGPCCVSGLGSLKYAKEFGTVKVCTSRGSGHTSSIAKLIEDKFDNVVLVLPTMTMKDIFNRNFPATQGKVTICTPNSLNRLLGLGNYQAVIVDCSSLIPKSKIEDIYNLTVNCMNPPLYVFME